jgi:hypothetical protein
MSVFVLTVEPAPQRKRRAAPAGYARPAWANEGPVPWYGAAAPPWGSDRAAASAGGASQSASVISETQNGKRAGKDDALIRKHLIS